ncbi:MAG: hypothetical protein KDA93_15575 [Planctomycetaceae bacterium]|nr:hypothetical protein [Planctomycetaceae bacterium]
MVFFQSLIVALLTLLFVAFYAIVFFVLQLFESVKEGPLQWIILGILGLVGLVYAFVPLMILAKFNFEAKPRIIPVDLDDYEWPPEADKLFRRASSTLMKLGFEIDEAFFLPSVVENVKTIGVLMVNRVQRDCAMIAAIYALPVQPGSLKNLYVEFTSGGPDDTVFDTNNSDQLSAFPTPDRKTIYQLPKVKDVADLYAIHQAIMQRDGLTMSSKTFKLDTEYRGDVIKLLQAGMGREFADAAADGYLKTDGETHYRPTVKGAFLMVWKELWPWKMVRRNRRDRKAAELLEELERQGVELRHA